MTRARTRNPRTATVLAAACALALPLATARSSAAAQLDAFASVEAGTAGPCTVTPVFFPGGPVFSGTYGVPVDFQACGFSADSGRSDVVEPSGAADASWIASSAQFSGASQAHAEFGVLGAMASGTNTAQGNGLGNAAGAFGAFTDTLTVTSALQPNGNGGYVVLHFGVDGQISVHNGSYDPGVQQLLGRADARVAVRVGTTPANVLVAQVVLNGPQVPSTTPLNASGFSATQEPTGWTFTGSTTAHSPPLAIEFGTPFVFSAALLAEAYPQTESLASGDASADFFTTATLTQIEILDAGQTPVPRWQLSAESGTRYAPEPEASLAAAAALATLLALASGLRRSALLSAPRS